MPSLQELVNQAQTDLNNLNKTWRQIQDVMNTYPNLTSDQKIRLLNVIHQSLEGVQAGSPSINVAVLEDQVVRHPDLGKEKYKLGTGFIVPH
jgi:hypothetical protein